VTLDESQARITQLESENQELRQKMAALRAILDDPNKCYGRAIDLAQAEAEGRPLWPNIYP